jgi:thiamine-monophosphate kinase
MIEEFEIIEWIKKNSPIFSGVKISIGDDAAVLKPSGNKNRLISTDMIIENIDFKINELTPECIGYKALAVNLSDMAAMGAVPTEFVISLGITKKQNFEWLKNFYKGIFKLARNYRVSCVGGDISASSSFLASVTILGETLKYAPILRKGAHVGDYIVVTGSLGGSILKKHYAFQPRVAEGIYLAKNKFATAMLDISDGFTQDLEHLLKASNKGASIDLDRIPIALAAYKKANQKKEKALEYALSDGEDFELLFTVPKSKRQALEKAWGKQGFKSKLFWVGTITTKKNVIEWCENNILIDNFKLQKKGYQHFK